MRMHLALCVGIGDGSGVAAIKCSSLWQPCFCCDASTCTLQVVGGIKSGLTLQQQMDSFLEAAQACREGGVNGRLRQVLKAQLQRCVCTGVPTC